MLRSCLQSALKLVNSVIGMAGMGMILYSLWMMRVWSKQIDGFGSSSTPPWFIYTFLGLGIFLCFITCSGHIAAETANGHCLSCDFPEDPTGKFDELKDFVRSNFEMCKWIGLLVVAAQALSIFLAIVLRALGPDHGSYHVDRGSYYDSDDDTVPARLPLLRNQVHHTPYTAEPNLSTKKDSWNVRIPEKVNR